VIVWGTKNVEKQGCMGAGVGVAAYVVVRSIMTKMWNSYAISDISEWTICACDSATTLAEQ